jgi:hypothetical protein
MFQFTLFTAAVDPAVAVLALLASLLFITCVTVVVPLASLLLLVVSFQWLATLL